MQPAEEIIIVHAGMRNYANSCEFFLAEMNGERRGKGEGNREFRFVLSSSFIRFLIILWRKDSGSFFLSFFFFFHPVFVSFVSFASERDRMETWVKRWPDEGEDNVCPRCRWTETSQRLET